MNNPNFPFPKSRLFWICYYLKLLPKYLTIIYEHSITFPKYQIHMQNASTRVSVIMWWLFEERTNCGVQHIVSEISIIYNISMLCKSNFFIVKKSHTILLSQFNACNRKKMIHGKCTFCLFILILSQNIFGIRILLLYSSNTLEQNNLIFTWWIFIYTTKLFVVHNRITAAL